MVKKSKRENLEEHQLNLNESLIRLELNKGASKPVIAFTSSNQIQFKEISVEFVLILYDRMTLEISCRAVYYLESLQILLLIFDEYIQIIKIDQSLNFSSTKFIKCCVTSDCIISIVKDMLFISKLNKLISYSKLPK